MAKGHEKRRQAIRKNRLATIAPEKPEQTTKTKPRVQKPKTRSAKTKIQGVE